MNQYFVMSVKTVLFLIKKHEISTKMYLTSKECFKGILHNSQEKNYIGVYFLVNLQA